MGVHTVCTDPTAQVERLFAGISSMLQAAIFLLTRLNSKAGSMAMTVYGAGCRIAGDQNGNTAIGY